MVLEKYREAFRDDEVQSISRRYFMSNGFDGTLTSIGIAVGSYLSGVSSGLTVFSVGAGAAIGLATSGVWSVWEIEKAEKLAELEKTEKAMQKDLRETRVYERKETGRTINALMSGLGPVIGAVITISPFLLVEAGLGMLNATLLSIVTGMTLLFGFGVYMSRISDRKWIVAGLRMAVAGLVVAALNLILPG